MQKLILSYTSTTPHPTDANRRYSKKCSMFANSVLFGVTSKNILKLQMVQNALACVVTDLQRRDHITSTLERLLWLPIKSRIDFKIASLTFKVRSTNKPAYLASFISYHFWTITTFSGSQPPRNSSCQNCCRRQSFQCCCFANLEQSTI